MRIVSHENLNGWRPQEMSMPLTQSLVCPACKVPLYVIAVFKGTVNVRVGGCDLCGYMGYIDRPSPAWFKEFYHERWDTVGQEQKESVYLRYSQIPVTRPESYTAHLLARVRELKFDKPLLDIGCGFGRFLQFAQKVGFKDIYGVEKSNHRADVAEKLGFQVYRGSFEDVDFKGKKFGVIAHHHVLEHVEGPEKFIEKCAGLQDPDDIMVLSVPNNLGEPTMGVLMFLPHIHSFTITAITRLLGRYNYEAFDFVLTNERTLNVIAIKRKDKVGTIPIKNFMHAGMEKLVKGLDLKKGFFNPAKRLVWSKHKDDAKQLYRWQKPMGFEEQRSLIVKQDKIKMPLEFDFKGYPELFVK